MIFWVWPLKCDGSEVTRAVAWVSTPLLLWLSYTLLWIRHISLTPQHLFPLLAIESRAPAMCGLLCGHVFSFLPALHLGVGSLGHVAAVGGAAGLFPQQPPHSTCTGSVCAAALHVLASTG